MQIQFRTSLTKFKYHQMDKIHFEQNNLILAQKHEEHRALFISTSY